MFCKNCGQEIGNARFCPNCGTDNSAQTTVNGQPVNNAQGAYNANQQAYQANQQAYQANQQAYQANQQAYANPQLDPGKGKATGALVCGILSLFGIGGIITAIIAMVMGKQYFTVGNGASAGNAKAGRVCGIIALILNIIAIVIGIIVIIVTVIAAGTASTSYYNW